MGIKVFAVSSVAEPLTNAICNALDIQPSAANGMRFTNGSFFVTPKEVIGEDVYLIQTVDEHVDSRIMELLIMVNAVRQARARKIIVVLPYAPYSRTDKKDQRGAPQTFQLFATLLEAAGVDHVLLCDLHNSSTEGFFRIPCTRLTTKSFLLKHLQSLPCEVVVAPDEGAVKRAKQFAEQLGLTWAGLDKSRSDNSETPSVTTVFGPGANALDGKVVLLNDDEADTLGTLTASAILLSESGCSDIYAACTHGVLSGPAIQRLVESPIKKLIVTDTYPILRDKLTLAGDKLEVIPVAKLFAGAIDALHNNKRLSKFTDYSVKEP